MGFCRTPRVCLGHGYGSGLGLWYVLWLHQQSPSAQLLIQKLHQQDSTEEKGNQQFLREVAHMMPRYFFWPWAGSSPVLAISSRMAVSACMFFMR